MIYIYSHFLIRNGLLWTHEEMSVSNSGILSKHVAYLPTIIPNSMANHPPIQPNNIFCLQQTIHMGLSENFVLIPPSIFCTHCPNTKRNPSMLATKSHSQARHLRSYKTKLEIYANSLQMGQRTTAMVTTSNSSSSKNTKNNKAKKDNRDDKDRKHKKHHKKTSPFYPTTCFIEEETANSVQIDLLFSICVCCANNKGKIKSNEITRRTLRQTILGIKKQNSCNYHPSHKFQLQHATNIICQQ